MFKWIWGVCGIGAEAVEQAIAIFLLFVGLVVDGMALSSKIIWKSPFGPVVLSVGAAIALIGVLGLAGIM